MRQSWPAISGRMNCRERLEKLPFKIRSLFTEIFEMFRCAVRVRRIPRIERAPESRDSLLFRLECLSFGMSTPSMVLFMHNTRTPPVYTPGSLFIKNASSLYVDKAL